MTVRGYIRVSHKSHMGSIIGYKSHMGSTLGGVSLFRKGYKLGGYIIEENARTEPPFQKIVDFSRTAVHICK